MTLLVSSAAFSSQATNNLEGNYECVGSEVNTHETFTCQMTIKKTGFTYASTANCTDGNSYRGTGIYDKNSHRLSTGFINPKKAEETGVSVTRVKTNGSLITEWTYLDKTAVGHTKCIKKQDKS